MAFMLCGIYRCFGELSISDCFFFLQQAVYDRMLVFYLYSILDGLSMLIYCIYCMNCRHYRVYLVHPRASLKKTRKWYYVCII